VITVNFREAAILNLLARNHGALSESRIKELIATLGDKAKLIADRVMKTPPEFVGKPITRYPFKKVE